MQHPLSGRTALVTVLRAARALATPSLNSSPRSVRTCSSTISRRTIPQTNTRASLLMTADFARRMRTRLGQSDATGARPGARVTSARPFEKPIGHVIWMTSGQYDGPMRGEVAYATSKAALAGVTKTAAAELLDVGVILNTVNPGPVNTGYLDPETTDRDLDWVPEFLAGVPRIPHA